MIRSLFLVCVLLLTININSQEYKIGDEIPEFKLWLTDGSRLTKNDILDKVVVFKFWFTSCLPCKIDIPELNQLVKKYKENQNIVFVAPALDRKDEVERFIYYTPFNFKLAYSAIDVSQQLNKYQAYPFYYVVKNGKFVYVDIPRKTSQIAGIKKAIKDALEE